MGLNWGAGLEAAGEGLETMSKTKIIEADMIYKEVSERNRERFRKSEREAGQEFTTGEREAGETWKAGESAKDRTQKQEEFEIRQADIRSRDEQNVAIREQSNLIQQQGNAIRERGNISAAEGRLADDTRLSQADDQGIIDAIDGKIEKLSDPFDTQTMNMSEEQVADELRRLEHYKDLVTDHGGAGARAYIKMAKIMPANESADVFSSTYAMMTPKERRKTDKRMLQIRRDKKVGKREAYYDAINEHIGKTEAEATPEAALDPNTGTIDSAAEEKTVTGVVPAPTPEPDVQALVNKVKPHIKNLGKSTINDNMLRGELVGVDPASLTALIEALGLSPKQGLAIRSLYEDAQKREADRNKPKKPVFLKANTMSGTQQ